MKISLSLLVLPFVKTAFSQYQVPKHLNKPLTVTDFISPPIDTFDQFEKYHQKYTGDTDCSISKNEHLFLKSLSHHSLDSLTKKYIERVSEHNLNHDKQTILFQMACKKMIDFNIEII